MTTVAAGEGQRSDVSRGRARVLVFVGAFVDLAAAGLLLGHALILHPTIRALEWPTAAARAAAYLVPGVVALLALVKGPSLLATAIVLNFATVIVIPESLFLAPIILLAMLPMVFAWIALREEKGKTLWGALVAGVLGIAAAIVLALGPQRNVDFSVLSREGRVVQSQATVIASCPSSQSGSFSGDGTFESGCDPIVGARTAESALALSGLALVAAVSFRGRRETSA